MYTERRILKRLMFVTFIVAFNTKKLFYFPFRHEMV